MGFVLCGGLEGHEISALLVSSSQICLSGVCWPHWIMALCHSAAHLLHCSDVPFPHPTLLYENKQLQICQSCLCHRWDLLCHAEQKHVRVAREWEWQQEMDTGSEKRGGKELQGKAPCQGLEMRQCKAQHTSLLLPGLGKMGCFLLGGQMPSARLRELLPTVPSLQSEMPAVLSLPTFSLLLRSCTKHTLLCCVSVPPLCGLWAGVKVALCLFFFFRRTLSALKRALEISMFSLSLSSSQFGFGFVDIFSPSDFPAI